MPLFGSGDIKYFWDERDGYVGVKKIVNEMADTWAVTHIHGSSVGHITELLIALTQAFRPAGGYVVRDT